jgi:hypothetical protein
MKELRVITPRNGGFGGTPARAERGLSLNDNTNAGKT